jgi:protoheme IX farnesyltransferase
MQADSAPAVRRRGLTPVIGSYLDLAKARIVFLVLITTACGYLTGAQRVEAGTLINVLLGTALLAAGTNGLNQYVERELDAKMNRTRSRPLPEGRISPRAALLFSSGIAIIGTAYLALAVNWLSAALGLFTLMSYVFVYTPLKRMSTINTLVGAIPGAVPPLIGWTAATGSLGFGGWIAFGIVFLWQLPHFMAISWLYREDYARGGFRMLAVEDRDGRAVASQALWYSIALVPVTLAPTFAGLAGPYYLAGAVLGVTAMIVASIRFLRDRSKGPARALFMISNLFLLTMMLLLVVDVRIP